MLAKFEDGLDWLHNSKVCGLLLCCIFHPLAHVQMPIESRLSRGLASLDDLDMNDLKLAMAVGLDRSGVRNLLGPTGGALHLPFIDSMYYVYL